MSMPAATTSLEHQDFAFRRLRLQSEFVTCSINQSPGRLQFHRLGAGCGRFGDDMIPERGKSGVLRALRKLLGIKRS